MAQHPDLSRRQFLLRSATLAGASLGGNALTQAGEVGPGFGSSELRLGFIGLGDRGRQLLSAALAASRVRIVTVCDIDPKRLKTTLERLQRKGASSEDLPRPESRVRGTTDADGVIADPEVDAVIISSPVFLHASQSVAALNAGKHVYCEKPMALDTLECRAVLAAARAAGEGGLVYQSGLQRRHNPRYRQSVAHLHSGEAGDVRFVRAQWHAVTPARKDKPWLHRREKSGDVVVEQACHQFDVFNWIFRSVPVKAIGMGGSLASATVGREYPGRDVFDHYAAMLEYPCGGKVQLSHLSYSIPDRRFAGIYELAFCEKSGVDLANALTWDSSGRTVELCKERGNETQLAVQSFVDSVLDGKRPEAGAEEAYGATMAALMCRRAIDEERAVKFEELEA
ncbi:MAG: Gfo/Idh/MocA family oxidoreductase [Planctomycetota bacterium]